MLIHKGAYGERTGEPQAAEKLEVNMNTLQRLLLISDSDQLRSPALERACALAKASGAALHILAYGGPAGALGMLGEEVRRQVRHDFITRQQVNLDQLSGKLLAEGLQVTAELAWTDKPDQEALRWLETRPVDLVIKATRHENLLKRAFITPLDVQLLRSCPVPLHLVSTVEHPLPLKVAAAVDLSRADAPDMALNERIVGLAQDFARQCAAKLHLVMAYEASQAFLAYAAGPVGWSEGLREELSGNLQGAFQQFAERMGVPEHRRHFLAGVAAKVIVEFAAREAVDVVVMGTLTQHAEHKVLGSTAEQILYKVPAIIALRPAQA